MQTTTDAGNCHTLHLFKLHSFFPLTWALNQTENQYQFVAVTQVSVRAAPMRHVTAWLKKEPLVLLDLSQRLLSALSGVMQQVETLMSGSAGERIEATLRMLALRFGKPQPDGSTLIDLKLSHQDIALLAGVSRETVTRELKKLIQVDKLKKNKFFWLN